MKKKLLMLLIAILFSFSFAVPAMADMPNEVEGIIIEDGDSTDSHMTQIYWRACPHCGELQFRVWSITAAYWLTDWIYA
ncbi:MAG: hypothetical protein FWG87_00175 [Defluviitaleaceae bacterium]|nr:hypothetical protein [Defluviitaleaceae bacterium]